MAIIDSLRFWKVLLKSEKWYEFLDHRPVDGWATYFLAQKLQDHINYRDDEIWNKPSTKVMPTNPCSRCNQRSFPWIHSIPWLSDAFCLGRCQCIESIESQVDLLHNTLESICTLKVYANKMVNMEIICPNQAKAKQCKTLIWNLSIWHEFLYIARTEWENDIGCPVECSNAWIHCQRWIKWVEVCVHKLDGQDHGV